MQMPQQGTFLVLVDAFVWRYKFINEKIIVKILCKVLTFFFLGVLITGVTLITKMCEESRDTLIHFKKVRVFNMLGFYFTWK